MKQRYLKLVRRTYRYLRHPRIRRIKWLNPFTKEIFHKRYWQPCRSSVANGLSVGLFCSMLPIPLQMFLAALGCLRAKGNVPIAAAVCWITNPITQIPIWILQQKFGHWLHHALGMPRIPLLSKVEFSKEFPGFTIFGKQLTEPVALSVHAGDFVLGFLAAGICLSLIAYPLVWLFCLFLPNRGKRVEGFDPSI